MNFFKPVPFLIVLTAPVLHGQNFLRSIFPSGSQIDVEADGVFSSDIKIVSSTFRFEAPIKGGVITGSYGRTTHDIDYAPAPGTFTRANNRDEITNSYSLGVERSLGTNLIGIFTGTYTNGFSDHRSIWIDEFYRQSFSFFPSFRPSNPQSYSFSAGLQWDYAPGRGSVLATVGFSSALIVAGTGFDPDTVLDPSRPLDVLVSEEEIDTFSGTLQWTAVVNPRLRSQQTIRLSQVENRQFRTQVQSEFAYRLSDHWTLRTQMGASNEEPTFESVYGGITFVYELNSHWQFDVGFRYYEDTGEISNTNFNTAAPGVNSTEASLGILWRKDALAVRASVALYKTDFDPVTNPANQVFANLYRDRDFVAARVALSYDF